MRLVRFLAYVGMAAGLSMIFGGWFSKVPDTVGMGAAVLAGASIVVDLLRGRK